MYTVVKSHASINGVTYSRGDKVELDDVLALHLLDQEIVISSVDTRLPTESDGLFEELNKEIGSLKGTIEKQKEEIARLTSELELKGRMISEYDAQAKRKRS